MDRLFLLLVMCVLGGIGWWYASPAGDIDKIDGVTLVAPTRETGPDCFFELQEVGVEWVAIVPFAFSESGEPEVHFDHERQWWGEKKEGVAETARMAHDKEFHVMIKPHVWVRRQGWPGEYRLSSENDWQVWEKQYHDYILSFARLAQEENVELFCIGTEFRIAAVERPDFWVKLIKDVRKFYSGKITYAANWDNFQNVTFWNALDYIGIDAYFPLSGEKTPSVSALSRHWQKPLAEIRAFAKRNQKQVIFTEFGYQSTDYCADGHWKHTGETLQANNAGQENAFEAFFQSVWPQSWFAGGFVWKWHMELPEDGKNRFDKEYTPQNKPAMKTLKKYYSPLPTIRSANYPPD